jgi:hypothetical protein
MAEIVSLAERRLKKSETVPSPDLDEELGKLSEEVLRSMALLLLGQPPGREEREP